MAEYFLQRPGARLHVTDIGAGLPVIFQHGLGGNAAQVAEFFPDDAGFRRLTLECRAHGRSEAGPVEMFSIAAFADDVLALADDQGLDRFVLGGTSMGAAIAVRIAALHPRRVTALVLVRPAWLFAAAPENMRPFVLAAGCLREAALARFLADDLAVLLARDAPDNLASLQGFFARPDPATTAALLEGIAADGPGVTAVPLTMPALVIGNGVDHVHPLALARALAEMLPRSTFVEVSPKARDRAAHAAETRAAIAAFLAGTMK